MSLDDPAPLTSSPDATFPGTPLGDGRSSERRALEAPVRMRLVTRDLQGTSDNVSRAGLLFFSDEPLRVELELEVDGAPKTFVGRLVRVQRMNETRTGVAVEFDA